MLRKGDEQSGQKGGVKRRWRRSDGKKEGKGEKESNNDRRKTKKRENVKRKGKKAILREKKH